MGNDEREGDAAHHERHETSTERGRRTEIRQGEKRVEESGHRRDRAEGDVKADRSRIGGGALLLPESKPKRNRRRKRDRQRRDPSNPECHVPKDRVWERVG